MLVAPSNFTHSDHCPPPPAWSIQAWGLRYNQVRDRGRVPPAPAQLVAGTFPPGRLLRDHRSRAGCELPPTGEPSEGRPPRHTHLPGDRNPNGSGHYSGVDSHHHL